MFKTAIAFIVVVWCIGVRATAQSEQGSAVNADDLQVYLPSELEVAFGDPLFVPIAVGNSATDEFIPAAYLGEHRSDLKMLVRAGESETPNWWYFGNADGAYPRDGGGHGGEYLDGRNGSVSSLTPQTTETTVLLVNIWSKTFATEFLKTGTGEVEFQLNAYHQDHPYAGANTRQPLKRTVRLLLRGYAISNAGMQTLNKRSQTARRELLTQNGSNEVTPFFPGATPLAWLDERYLNWKYEDFPAEPEWFDMNSQLNTQAREFALPNTKLERLMQFSALFERIKLRAGQWREKPWVEPTLKDWNEFVESFCTLLKTCSFEEHQF